MSSRCVLSSVLCEINSYGVSDLMERKRTVYSRVYSRVAFVVLTLLVGSRNDISVSKNSRINRLMAIMAVPQHSNT